MWTIPHPCGATQRRMRFDHRVFRQWMSSGKQSRKRRSNKQPNRDRSIEICLTRGAAFNPFQAVGRLFGSEQVVITGMVRRLSPSRV